MSIDKTIFMLPIFTGVAYLIHFVFRNCAAKYRCWSAENEHIVMGFQEIKTSNALEHSCSIHEGWPFMYWFLRTDEVHAEVARLFY